MCFLVAGIALVFILSAWGLYLAHGKQGGIPARLPTVLGILITLGSFAFLGWVKLSPVGYMLDVVADVLTKHFPDTLDLIPQILDSEGAKRVVSTILSLGGIPGWLLVIIIPTTDLFVRIILILVPFTAGMSLLWLPFSSIVESERVRRFASLGQAVTAFLVAILLLIQIPKIDALTNPENLFLRFLALIGGAQVGFATWLAWAGILLLGIGGLVLASRSAESSPPEGDSGEASYDEPDHDEEGSCGYRTGKALTILGAMVVLLGLFLPPWIHFLEPGVADEQVSQFLNDARIQEVMSRVPQIRQVLEIPDLENIDDVYELFTDPEMQQIISLTRETRHFSAWALRREMPRMAGPFRLGLLLALVVAITVTVWSALTLIGNPGQVGQGGTVICIVLTFVVLLWMLWYVPTVDTFGLRSDSSVDLACLLAGSQTGGGIWMTILGLALILIGGQVELASERYPAFHLNLEDRSKDNNDYTYDQERGWN